MFYQRNSEVCGVSTLQLEQRYLVHAAERARIQGTRGRLLDGTPFIVRDNTAYVMTPDGEEALPHSVKTYAQLLAVDGWVKLTEQEAQAHLHPPKPFTFGSKQILVNAQNILKEAP